MLKLFTDFEMASYFVIYSLVGMLLGIYGFFLFGYIKKLVMFIRKKINARKERAGKINTVINK